jgi:hypothetical protein
MLDLEPMNISGKVREKPAKSKRASKVALKSLDPLPEPQVAAPEIKEQVGLEQPQMEAAPIQREIESQRQPENTNWDWGDALIGITPVLAGYLSGEPAVGYSYGGQGLLDRQKEIIEANKQKAKLLREKSSRDSLKPVKMEDGSIRYLSESEAEGQEVGYAGSDLENYARRKAIAAQSDVKEAEMKGSVYNIKTDPQSGMLQRIDKRTGEVMPVGDVSSLSPKARKDAMKYVGDYNKAIGKDIEGFSDLENAFKNLKENNQLGNKLAVMRFVKEVETRLSDYDRKYYTSEISAARDIQARARELSGNKMNPRLVREATKLTARALDKIKKRVNDNRNRFQSQLKGVRPELKQQQLEEVFGVKPNMAQGTYMKKGEDVYEVPWGEVPSKIEQGFKFISVGK